MQDFTETNYVQTFVIASYVLSVLGSYISLSFIEKLIEINERRVFFKINNHIENKKNHNKRPSSIKYSLISGLIFGGLAVWSMHFTGQIALLLPVKVNYNIFLTLLSFLIVTISATVSFQIITRNYRSYKNLFTSGAVLGLGVIGMHYIGMYSMRFNGFFILEKATVLISIVIALIVSTAALWLACRARSFKTRFMAALLLGGGISAVHYSGTSAANFICY